MRTGSSNGGPSSHTPCCSSVDPVLTGDVRGDVPDLMAAYDVIAAVEPHPARPHRPSA